MTPRVAITGAGVRTAIGGSVEEFWSACLAGRTRVEPIPARWYRYADYHSRLWSPLDDRAELLEGCDRVAVMQSDPVALLAVAAAHEALADSGREVRLSDVRHRRYELPGVDSARTGVWMGTGIGGLSSILENHAAHVLERPRRALAAELGERPGARELLGDLDHPARFSPFVVPRLMPNAVSATLGIRFSLHGPNTTLTLACAAGTAAIGHALRALRAGAVDVALAGGAEYLDDAHGGMFRGFDAAGALVRDCEDPERANRPFDQGHSGFLYAQGGAAVLVLEDLERARARGAHVYAEVAGFGESFDAYSAMAIEPSGTHIEHAIRAALDDAGVAPAAVGYVNAHGTGTAVNDETEAAVIERTFGRDVAIAATKSLIGHTIGAAGAIEALVTALTLDRRQSHMCRNLDEPVRPLRFVRTASAIDAHTGISQSFAFGGHNAVLVLRRADAPPP